MSGSMNLAELLESTMATLDQTAEADVGGDDDDSKTVIHSRPVEAVGKKAAGSGGRMGQVGVIPTHAPRAARFQLFSDRPELYVSCTLDAPDLAMADPRTLVRSGPASGVAVWTSDEKTRQIVVHSTSPAELAADGETLTPVGVTVNMTTRRSLPTQTGYQAKDSSKVSEDCKVNQKIKIEFFRSTRIPKSGDMASSVCAPLNQLADLFRVPADELRKSIQPDQVAELTLNLDAISAAGAANSSKRITVVGVEGICQLLLLVNTPAEYQIGTRSPVGTTKISLPVGGLGSLPHSAFVHYVFLIVDSVRAKFSNSNESMQKMRLECEMLTKQNEQLKIQYEKLKAQAALVQTSLSRVIQSTVSGDKQVLRCTPVQYFLSAIVTGLTGKNVPDMTPIQKQATLACIPVCAGFNKPGAGSPTASAGNGGSAGIVKSTPAAAAAAVKPVAVVKKQAVGDSMMSDGNPVIAPNSGIASPYPKF